MIADRGRGATASVPRSRGSVALAIVVGATLLVLQYLGRLSLHTDEAAIALNLRSHSLWALLSQPLDYAQMGPPGWLLLEWGAFHLFGSSEYVLRAVPLIASLAALVLAARLAWRASGGIAPALTVLWLGTSWDFLFFGTQVKQYGSDVLVALLLMLLAMRAIDGDAPPRWRDGVLGALAVGCSQAGAFVAAALGAVLVVDALATRERRVRSLVPLLLPWGAASVGVAAWTLALTPPALSAYMGKFWAYTFAPWPLGPTGVAWWGWTALRKAVFDPMSGGLGGLLPKAYAVLFVIGAIQLVRRNRRHAAILMAPIAMAFTLAMLHRYPIGGRVTLYLLPACFLSIAAGGEWIARLMTGRLGARSDRERHPVATFGAAMLGLALAIPALRTQAMHPPPAWLDNTRPVVAATAAAVRDGDAVYVHHSIAKPFDWYWPGLAHADVPLIRGHCYNGDPRPYLAEVDRLRGQRRLWIVTADTSWNGYPMVSAYLKAIAPVRDSAVSTAAPRPEPGARQVTYLRTFADSAALAAARADTIPIPEGWTFDYVGWTCFGAEPTPVIHPSLWR